MSEAAAERRRGALGLLRDRNFAPYLVGNMLSTTGTWFLTLTNALLVYRLTGSTFLLGVVGFALDRLMAALEQRLQRWRIADGHGERRA